MAAQRTAEVARRAARRLDILEWVLLLLGVALATLGGAGVAWLVAGDLGWSFRTTWITASVVLFAVPGAVALFQLRREERRLDGASTEGAWGAGSVHEHGYAGKEHDERADSRGQTERNDG